MWKVWVSSFSGPKVLCVYKPGAAVKLKLHLPSSKSTLESRRKDISGSLWRITSIIVSPSTWVRTQDPIFVDTKDKIESTGTFSAV